MRSAGSRKASLPVRLDYRGAARDWRRKIGPMNEDRADEWGIRPSRLPAIPLSHLPTRRRSVTTGIRVDVNRNRKITPIRAEVAVTPDLGRVRARLPPVGRRRRRAAQVSGTQRFLSAPGTTSNVRPAA